MRETHIDSDSARKLAAFIDGRRSPLVASVVRSTVSTRPGSVTANVFAETFLDRLCTELRTGDDELERWAGSSAHREDAAERARIVLVACAVVSAAYAAALGQADDVASYLALRSRELETRLARAPGAREDPAVFVNRDEVVRSLLAALDARDKATCDHSRAVGMWCGRIAKSLSLSREERTLAVLAGTLHDVGKIATPRRVLLKAGPLDADEWVTMREHSRIGAEMLEEIPSMRELAPIVRAHHERLDGRGYPDGLSGNDIPLAARIVAVADSFHAMISTRPYRRPLVVSEALQELSAGMGTQWDRSVTEAMLRIVQPSGFARARAVQSAL